MDRYLLILLVIEILFWVMWKVFTLSSLRRVASLAILTAIAGMLVVLSCHVTSLQFAQSAIVQAPSLSCEEHQIHPGAVSIEKSIFDAVLLPGNEIFFVVAAVIVAVAHFPRNDRQGTRAVQVIFSQNKRKRWIWARRLPFFSIGFLPYFFAQRDY